MTLRSTSGGDSSGLHDLEVRRTQNRAHGLEVAVGFTPEMGGQRHLPGRETDGRRIGVEEGDLELPSLLLSLGIAADPDEVSAKKSMNLDASLGTVGPDFVLEDEPVGVLGVLGHGHHRVPNLGIAVTGERRGTAPAPDECQGGEEQRKPAAWVHVGKDPTRAGKGGPARPHRSGSGLDLMRKPSRTPEAPPFTASGGMILRYTPSRSGSRRS